VSKASERGAGQSSTLLTRVSARRPPPATPSLPGGLPSAGHGGKNGHHGGCVMFKQAAVPHPRRALILASACWLRALGSCHLTSISCQVSVEDAEAGQWGEPAVLFRKALLHRRRRQGAPRRHLTAEVWDERAP
jgi:hypothetical protein